MISAYYAHRYADIILNADYTIKKEIDEVIASIDFKAVESRYTDTNLEKVKLGKKPLKGKQTVINTLFREEFKKRDWAEEFCIFKDPDNDLKIDFWKREIGVDVAFNHRSFIGGDLLRLQAGAEVKNVINVGVYICPTREFAKLVSPNDASSMVTFERTQWYLKNFYAVLTVPILLIGLKG